MSVSSNKEKTGLYVRSENVKTLLKSVFSQFGGVLPHMCKKTKGVLFKCTIVSTVNLGFI